MAIPKHLQNQSQQRPFQNPAQGGGQRPQHPGQQGQAQGQRPFQNQGQPQGQQGGRFNAQNYQGERRVQNPFKGGMIDQAQANMRADYWTTGPRTDAHPYGEPRKHRGRIDVVKSIESYKKPGVLFFVVEFTALASQDPAILIGGRRSWVVNLSERPSYGDVKNFVAICFGVPTEEIDDAICNAVCSENQPLRGFVLDVVCAGILTNKNNIFTRHEWALVCEAGGAESRPDIADPPPMDTNDIPF